MWFWLSFDYLTAYSRPRLYPDTDIHAINLSRLILLRTRYEAYFSALPNRDVRNDLSKLLDPALSHLCFAGDGKMAPGGVPQTHDGDYRNRYDVLEGLHLIPFRSSLDGCVNELLAITDYISIV